MVAIHELGVVAIGWDGETQWAFDTGVVVDREATGASVTVVDDEGRTWVAARETGLVGPGGRTPTS